MPAHAAESYLPETEDARALAGLREVMSHLTTERLVGISPESFESRLRAMIGEVDPDVEGFADPSRQRDLSIKFRFGHNHDFGAFRLDGQMGDRHLHILAAMVGELGALPMDLSGARVLDIGCWTGGTTLLLAEMGAEVVALEEVRKYAACTEFLAESFGLGDRVRVVPRSLYQFTDADAQDTFDYVLFAGVLYHLTDPVLALRLCFNCTRDAGTCLIESAGMNSDDCLTRYHGPVPSRSGAPRKTSTAPDGTGSSRTPTAPSAGW
ncbi:MAG: DUF1698 domain-containing protein [Phycisphaerales bacterium]